MTPTRRQILKEYGTDRKIVRRLGTDWNQFGQIAS